MTSAVAASSAGGSYGGVVDCSTIVLVGRNGVEVTREMLLLAVGGCAFGLAVGVRALLE